MAANLGEVKKDLQGIRGAIDKINLGVVRADQTVQKINSSIQLIRKFMVYINVWLWVSLAAMIILVGVVVFLQWKNLNLIIKLISTFYRNRRLFFFGNCFYRRQAGTQRFRQ